MFTYFLCRKNSYHSDIVAVGQLGHKVIHIEHVTKEQEPSSQRHEAYGTRRMYESLTAHGVTVRDHAHDRNTTVNKDIKERGINNSNDCWHVAKAVGLEMKKLASGPKKWHGVKWHQELADKVSGVRNHFYWAMKNAKGDANLMRTMLDNMPHHYQNNHTGCYSDSTCKKNGYIPDWVIVKEKVAVDMLTKFIRSTTAYRNAADYVYGRDTFYVESFNNVCLIYLDKRLHYKNEMYECRSNLAVLDWNEHVGRPASSIRLHLQSAARSRRTKGERILTAKRHQFVKDLWSLLRASADIERDEKTANAKEQRVEDKDKEQLEDGAADNTTYETVYDQICDDRSDDFDIEIY
jgi:hypothetical protein